MNILANVGITVEPEHYRGNHQWMLHVRKDPELEYL